MEHVAVCIPTITSRTDLLARALRSVEAQDVPPWLSVSAHVHVDTHRRGASTARNYAIDLALSHRPDWLLFLDDDDELLPHAVRTLVTAAHQHDADLVWGWYDLVGNNDPWTERAGRRLSAKQDGSPSHVVPIVYLARASEFSKAHARLGGAFQVQQAGEQSDWTVQDWPVLRDMLHHGAEQHPITERVWVWHHHGKNTSGMPDRGA